MVVAVRAMAAPLMMVHDRRYGEEFLDDINKIIFKSKTNVLNVKRFITSSPLNSPFFMTNTLPNTVVLCMNSTETAHSVLSSQRFLEAVFIQQDNAYDQWS